MPFQPYDTYEAIPEAFDRTNFKQGKDGKWYAQVADTHPLVVKKNELVGTISSNSGKLLQAGQRAVSIEDFTLLTNLKGLNVPTAEIVTRLQEYPTLKERETTATREESYTEAAKLLKYPNVEAFKTTLSLAGVELTFKDEAVAGSTDKVKVPYVGDKRFTDHLEATPNLKTMEAFWKVQPPNQQQQTRSEAGTGNRPGGASNTSSSATAGGASAGQQQNNGQQQQQQQNNQQQPPPPAFSFAQTGDVAWPAE